MSDRNYSRANATEDTTCSGCQTPIAKGGRVILAAGECYCGSSCRIFRSAVLADQKPKFAGKRTPAEAVVVEGGGM